MRDWNVDRRSFLLGLGPAVAGTALATSVAHASPVPPPYKPTYFTSFEWAFVNAAVDRLIPADAAGPGGIEAGVPEFLDRQLELPYGHGAYFYMQGPFQDGVAPQFGIQTSLSPREIYRSGIALVDEYCRRKLGEAFSGLPNDTRDELLLSLEHGRTDMPGTLAGLFFGQLLTNTKEGYFADPLYGGNRDMGAWKMIGFPGARADFTDWIDRAGTPYPYGPVSVNGA